jgi:peptidoglycan hydrolase CwlO-like protein
MNVERTMEFILENLASVTAKQEKAESQIQSMRKLVVTGLKMMVDIQKGQKRTDRKMAELATEMAELAEEMAGLAAAQKATDRRFGEWLASNKGSNGHKGGNGHKKKPN